MGRACSTYGVREERYTGIWWEKPEGDLRVDGKIILRWIF